MKNIVLYRLTLLSLLLLIFACQKSNEPYLPSGTNNSGNNNNNNNNNNNTAEWLIPVNEVRDGGPGKDGIPSIDDPKFQDVSAIDYLADEDLIIGIKIGDQIRGYTHPVLDWHEIVNDRIDDEQFAITYCPLTGTASGWNRIVNNKVTTFGVSGLLYNSNLIPYDRATDSNWSQIRLDCVNGDLKETIVQTYPLIETTWRTWKSLFPNSKVLTEETGYNRRYGNYPYGNYKTSNDLIFNVNPMDDRLHPKERVLGVLVNNKARVYQFKKFDDAPTVVIQDQFEGESYVVIGSKTHNFLVAYKSVLDGKELSFSVMSDDGTGIFSDDEGNKWNLFGEAIEGPRQGQRLEAITSFMGYFFAWGAFYPMPRIN